MAALSRVIDALATHTGIPGPVIGRYADKLAEANLMPEDGVDLMPDDAAVLIVALAAARAAMEAVEAVEAYRWAPMVVPSIVAPIGSDHVEPKLDAVIPESVDDLEAAQASVIGCLGMLLGQIPMRDSVGLPGAITVEIRRSTAAPFASIYIANPATATLYHFRFAPTECHPDGPWQEWSMISDDLFAAVAELFDETRPVAAKAQPVALH